MMATALESNGAAVYILGRRLHVLEQAAKERAVSNLFVNPHLVIRKHTSCLS